jgi:hypothetical protein
MSVQCYDTYVQKFGYSKFQPKTRRLLAKVSNTLHALRLVINIKNILCFICIFMYITAEMSSQGSVVCVVTGLSPGGVKNCLFSMGSRPALVSTQPPVQWVLGALSPGVKAAGV